MRSKTSGDNEVIQPHLQISFYYRLQTLKEIYLQGALKNTVQSLDIATLDDELAEWVSAGSLKRVASFGVRGEVFFPVPCIILKNPFLLGYYRLLFGISQKEFEKRGLGKFKRLEERGDITTNLKRQIPALCRSLIKTAQALVDGIDDVSPAVAHELQLLTIGPQLRGRENNQIGKGATREVFDLMMKIVSRYVKDKTERTILIENDSNRHVLIEFLSDPDIRITEKLPTGVRPLVSMEIKGGADASNIHNRLGEAEKSHQKARNLGFFEFWTITRVNVDPGVARRESPTTSRFFHLSRIMNRRTREHAEFRDLLGSLSGISR